MARIRPAPFVWELLKLCIAVSGWFSLSGWCLSALGYLNRTGYFLSIILGAAAVGLWVWKRGIGLGQPFQTPWTAWRRRLRRPVASAYFLALALALLGGAIYPPNNFDALTYRVPQLLHWLDTGSWHWIATSNQTLNITAPGYTWLMAPLLALTGNDRAFFLPNIVAFAFFPGLFFSVARAIGVRRKVAWYWMWIVPTGYCFALQAGSIANDLLPAVYLLAAVALAFRARASAATGSTASIVSAWFSILAAALATGVKVVVLPLGLPWLVAGLPMWKALVRRPVASILVAILGMAISFLPTAVLNSHFSGSWAGDPQDALHLRIDRPLFGVTGNTLQLIATNLQPPLWPIPGPVNAAFDRFHTSSIGQSIRQNYRRFDLQWLEMPTEDGAGIGLGIVVLAAAAIGASFARREGATPNPPMNRIGLAMGLAACLAAVSYSAKLGSEAAPRLFAAYYPFLLLFLLLLPTHQNLVPHRWWRALAFCCAASILPTMILNPARPLWPAGTVLARLHTYPGLQGPLLERTQRVYDTLAQRHDYLQPLKKFIPADAHTVGFVPTGNDLEGSLWQPFGSRRVVEVLTAESDDPAVRRLRGSVIICSPRGVDEHFKMTVEQFCAAIGGRVVGEATTTLKASVGPKEWCVIAL